MAYGEPPGQKLKAQFVAGLTTLTPPQTGYVSSPWFELVPSMTLSVPPLVMLGGDTWNWGPVSVPVDADTGPLPYVTAATRNRKIATADNQDLANFNLTRKSLPSYYGFRGLDSSR
jgi:hypothetical protein